MRKQRLARTIQTFGAAFLLAGVFVMLCGLYYLMFKAGIPYQDPTPELQFRYEVNFQIGEVLTDLAGCFLLAGAFFSISGGVLKKKADKRTEAAK